MISFVLLSFGCNEQNEFTTPELRSRGIQAQTPQHAFIADWAITEIGDRKLELVSISIKEQPWKFNFHDSETASFYDAALEIVLSESKEGYYTTFWMPLSLNNDDKYIPSEIVGTGVKCVGKNCSACKLRSPLSNNAYCDCTRISNPDSPQSMECNMEISIGLGLVLPDHELSMFKFERDFSFTP